MLAREDDFAARQREKSVIASDADIAPGMKFRAALPHDDGAGVDDLSAGALDAEPLARRVASVARGAAGFFVRHCSAAVSGVNFADADARQRLPVSAQTAVIFAPQFFEHEDFIAAILLDDFGADAGVGDERLAECACGAAEHEHAVEGDVVAFAAVESFHGEFVAGGDAVLLAAGFNDGVVHL